MRVTRREPADAASVVLQGGFHDFPSLHEEDGDFMIVSKMLALPPADMLGVMLDTKAGRVSVQSFAILTTLADISGRFLTCVKASSPCVLSRGNVRRIACSKIYVFMSVSMWMNH